MELAHGKSTTSIWQTTRGTRKNHLKTASDTEPYNFQSRAARRRTVIDRCQMCLPTRARSRAKVRLRVSCFLAGSSPGAHFRKYRRTVRGILGLRTRGRQLRTPAYEVFARAVPRPLAFFLRVSAGPDSPHL